MRCAVIALIVGVMAGAMATAGRAGEAGGIPDHEIERIVLGQIDAYLPADMPGGVAVAVREGGRTLFVNRGFAARHLDEPVTADSLFNLGSLGKVFISALLAKAHRDGVLNLDDPVAKHVTELQAGSDMRRVTLRQLASYTSGFVLPQDLPPWPERFFTLPQFIATLNDWEADAQHEPGQQMIYSHAGYMLLHLALERRFGMPIGQLVEQQISQPLGLSSTVLPFASRKAHPRGKLPSALARRAVQGYSPDGERIGKRGGLQGFYLWLGTGQMYSSPRDMAVFPATALGERPDQPALQAAIRLAQQSVLLSDGEYFQALAWEIRKGEQTIVDKYGGLNNATAYIGMIHNRRLGVVILANRGRLGLDSMGRDLLLDLARAR